MNPTPITITPPEGYEVCPTSTQTEIRFRPISKSKPKWEDFGKVNGWCLDICGNVLRTHDQVATSILKTIWPTKEEAEACLALSQLCQWRDKYNQGWKPNEDHIHKHAISVSGTCDIFRSMATHSVLMFKSEEIANKFLEDFRELIEIAKPLL